MMSAVERAIRFWPTPQRSLLCGSLSPLSRSISSPRFSPRSPRARLCNGRSRIAAITLLRATVSMFAEMHFQNGNLDAFQYGLELTQATWLSPESKPPCNWPGM